MKIRAKADSRSPGADEGWAVITTLIGGMALWTLIGYFLDRWLSTHFLLPIGAVVGMALGIYAVVARYGRTPPSASAVKPSDQSPWVAPFESRLIAKRDSENSAAPVDSVAPRNAQSPDQTSTRRETRCP